MSAPCWSVLLQPGCSKTEAATSPCFISGNDLGLHPQSSAGSRGGASPPSLWLLFYPREPRRITSRNRPPASHLSRRSDRGAQLVVGVPSLQQPQRESYGGPR